MIDSSHLLATADVARRLNISAERVRQLDREGRLVPVMRTRTMRWRLYDVADVDAYGRERRQSRVVAAPEERPVSA